MISKEPMVAMSIAGLWEDLRARQAVAADYDGELDVECPRCGAGEGYLCRSVRGDAAVAVGLAQIELGVPMPPHAERFAALQRHREDAVASIERRRVDRIRGRLELADVPADHINALLGAGYHVTEALGKTTAWRDAGHRSLVLLGARGVGKSVAAAWAVGEGPLRHPAGHAAAQWVHASELAALELYGAGRLEELRRCGLLVIDELGGGEQGEPMRFRARLEGLLCVRHDRCLQTVVTSNMSVGEFRDAVDERVRDRLRSHGTVYSCNTTRSLRTGRES